MSFERIKQNTKALSEAIQNYKNIVYKITSIENEIAVMGNKKKIKEGEKETESLKIELNKIRSYALKLCNDNSSIIKQEKINLIKNAAA